MSASNSNPKPGSELPVVIGVPPPKPLGGGLHRLDLEVQGTPLSASMKRAGQYVRLSLVEDSAETYLALCSAPADGDRWTFLLQEGGTVVDHLLKAAEASRGPLQEGAPSAAQPDKHPNQLQLQLRPAEGKGFGIEDLKQRDLLLLAGGSGLSAIRSVLRQALFQPASFGRVILMHGVRSPDQFAFQEEHEFWEAKGVELHPVVSGEAPDWRGARGHLQDHLHSLSLSPDRCTACVCGPKAFQASMVDALGELMIKEEHVLRNF